MNSLKSLSRLSLAAAMLATVSLAPAHARAQTAATHHDAMPHLLNREQAQAILPPSVFYRGQSASVQGRNSAGLRLAGDKLVLFTLVDTSGYSSAVQQTYQAYLLTEVPLNFGSQTLKPGAYGFGFVAGDKMVVLDLGANELFRIDTVHDETLKRPNPLQLLASPNAGEYRLFLGRSYAAFTPAAQ